MLGAWDGVSSAFPGGVDAGSGQLATLGISARSVHCGGDYSLVSNGDGTVSGWGTNTAYPLTVDRPLEQRLPIGRSPSLTGFSNLSAGLDLACGLKANKPYCWGLNDRGQATGTLAPATMPTDLGIVDAAEVYAGVTHSCAQLAGGRILCWGSNDFSQISSGPSGLKAPTEVLGLAQ